MARGADQACCAATSGPAKTTLRTDLLMGRSYPRDCALRRRNAAVLKRRRAGIREAVSGMETCTYRAAPSAYVVFGSITGALGVLWLVAVWRAGAPWLPLVLPVAGFVGVAMWLSRFRLSFAADEVFLRVPFRGKWRLARNEILSVEFADETGRDESPLTLCIRTSFGEELRLNSKIFSTEAIQRLLALAPQPTMSKRPR